MQLIAFYLIGYSKVTFDIHNGLQPPQNHHGQRHVSILTVRSALFSILSLISAHEIYICISVLIQPSSYSSMIGLVLLLAAVALVSITIVRPLWTVWGKSETSKIIDLSYSALFKTTEEGIADMGLADYNCTSYMETTYINNNTQVVEKWNYTVPIDFGKGDGQNRRKRQALIGTSDNDNCCSTFLWLTSPSSIITFVPGLGYVNLHVVQFHWLHPTRYQFVHEGACGISGLCGLNGGSCVIHPRIQPVLVSLDPINSVDDLTYAVYDERVWFQDYAFPGSCKCVGSSFK